MGGYSCMKKAGMIQYHSLRILLLVVICLFGLSRVSLAADDFYLYGTVESFVWKEFADNGSRVVKESGPLIGIGLAYSHEFEDRITFTPKGEIFFGSVDYDGQTQVGVPVTSTVDYFGFKFDGDLSIKYKVTQRFSLEPFGGLGLRWWIRDIKDGTTSTGAVASGYTEAWTTLYGRLGVRGGIDVSTQMMMFLETGVMLPFFNENTAYLSDAGLGPDVTIHPGRQASFFAEAGLKISRVKASLFYDSMKFSRSANVVSGANIYWQPQSTADIYGVKVGVVF
jgi:hypothetical protein